MSDNKKYYYLKLKDGFFSSEEMKILAAQKNGADYQLLYMKLTLLSVKSEGRLEFRHGVPYDAEMLSSILDVNIDTIKSGIELFSKLHLVEMLETGVIFMADIQNMIGHGSSEAERKAAYRLRIQGERDNVQQLSQNCPPELELELELELEKEIELKKEKGSRFAPPTIQEVSEYMSTLQNYVNGDDCAMHDYYTANGWKVGRSTMRDWKATCRTWLRNKVKWAKVQRPAVGIDAADSSKFDDMKRRMAK